MKELHYFITCNKLMNLGNDECLLCQKRRDDQTDKRLHEVVLPTLRNKLI